MSEQDVPYTRGLTSVREVVAKMKPLAEWCERFKPEIESLTLPRKDYDLLARWPKAAELCDCYTSGEELKYRYFNTKTRQYKVFVLKFDKNEKRYKHAVPLTTSEIV